MELANPFPPLRRLHGIACPIPLPKAAAWHRVPAQPGVLCGWLTGDITQPSPKDHPLLPWPFPAPLCQLQDGVENPRTRNFLTDMQTLGLPQPFAVRNAVSSPMLLQISGFLSPCTHTPCCIPVGTCPAPRV